MSHKIEGGHFSSRRGPVRKATPSHKPRLPFDTREFVDDVCQIQKSVSDPLQARELVVLTIRMVRETLLELN